MDPNLSIPLFLEALKKDDHAFIYSRLSFHMVIQREDAGRVSPVSLTQLDGLPVLPMSMMGVIYRPSEADTFERYEMIESLFDRVRQTDGLLLDTSYLWLPTAMLYHSLLAESPEIGDVFRVSPELFQAAVDYREGRIDDGPFREICRTREQELRPSEIETRTFAQFAQSEVWEARRQYPKNQTDSLAWNETEGDAS